VHAGAQLDSQLAHGLAQALGAAHRPGGTVEGGEHAVARGLHDAPALRLDRAVRERVVALEQVAPGAVAELTGAPRGVDDVGEEHRGERALGGRCLPLAREELLDLVEDRVEVAEPEGVVLARQDLQLRTRDPRCELLGGPHRRDPVVLAMEHQGRRLHGRKR
jgi:hypothetical protein